MISHIVKKSTAGQTDGHNFESHKNVTIQSHNDVNKKYYEVFFSWQYCNHKKKSHINLNCCIKTREKKCNIERNFLEWMQSVFNESH